MTTVRSWDYTPIKTLIQALTNILLINIIMGMVFGKINVETPKFKVIKSLADFEIRQYSPSVKAEVTYDPTQFKGDKDAGFKILANYIGAFGSPQNTKPEKIVMTSPVLTTPEKIAMTSPVMTKAAEKIDMTSPVVTKGEGGRVVTMQFTLPEKYKKASEAPLPVDERVVIREDGERKYGVVTFSGVASEQVVAKKVEKLKKDLEGDGLKITGDYVLGRYNPPWITLPAFRTNEVLIPVE